MNNQQQFPNSCSPRPKCWVATARYTARCANGEPYYGGFPGWIHTGSGKQLTINGLDLISKEAAGWTFLALHDSSLPVLKRMTKYFIAANGSATATEITYNALIPGNNPSDVEAMCRFPFEPVYFLVASNGLLIRGNHDPGTTVFYETARVTLPAGVQVEGLALAELPGGRTIIAWASRGSDATPATVYWADFDWSGMAITSPVQSVTISAPFPTNPNVRHIADMRIDSGGNLFIASSSDPGDNGPFASAVYQAGTFWDSGLGGAEPIQYIANAGLFELYRSTDHKIEAICRTPHETGGMILGADDENFGGSIFIQGQRVEGMAVGEPVTVIRQARSSISYEDAYAKAMALAKAEAMAELACRFSATACVTPVCSDYFWTMDGSVLVSGHTVSQYPPICRTATSPMSPEHANDLARLRAQAAAASYCQ